MTVARAHRGNESPCRVTPRACPEERSDEGSEATRGPLPHPDERGWCPTRDADGVLCAAALEPDRLSRNRHFTLFADPAFRRAHARAQSLRSLACTLRARHGRDVLIEPHGDRTHLVYRDAEISLTRRVALDALELSVLRVLVAGVAQTSEALRAIEADRLRVREALVRSGIDPDATGAFARH